MGGDPGESLWLFVTSDENIGSLSLPLLVVKILVIMEENIPPPPLLVAIFSSLSFLFDYLLLSFFWGRIFIYPCLISLLSTSSGKRKILTPNSRQC